MSTQMQREPERTQQQAQPSYRPQHSSRDASKEGSLAKNVRQAYETLKREELQRERELREDKLRLERDVTYLCDEWQKFQEERHLAPPVLLPLEAFGELEAFKLYVDAKLSIHLHPLAFRSFAVPISRSAENGKSVIRSLVKSLRSAPLWALLSKHFHFRKIYNLLKQCKLSLTAPMMGSPAAEAAESARRFIRKRWSNKIESEKQALLAVHRSAGKTVIHLGSSLYGSAFITLPTSLEPDELAEGFLSAIKGAAKAFFKSDNTIAIVDGAYQQLNYNHIFPKNVVVRSIADNCDRLAENLDAMLHTPRPKPENSALHLGVPRNADELDRVFPRGGADWDLWKGVAERWSASADRQGFERPAPASAQNILASLTTSRNVIVIVAHATGRSIHLAWPPPEGSTLTAEEVEQRKAEILANRPVVYLFCCETAEITGLKNFAEVLIASGAAAVVAPQTKIDAGKCIRLFDELLSRDFPAGDALSNVHRAEQASGYREMEVWVG